MADARELLRRGVALLMERYGTEDAAFEDYQWTHAHCDEDSGGNHRLDGEWLDNDIVEWLKAAREETFVQCGLVRLGSNDPLCTYDKGHAGPCSWRH